MTKIRVAELFAGVGGFRLGLEGGWEGEHHRSSSATPVCLQQPVGPTKPKRGKKRITKQWASKIYEKSFG